MTLQLQFFAYIRNFFGHCHLTLPYKVILSLFGHCHLTFPYKEPLSFFGRFVQKLIISCFSDSFVQKTTQHSDGSCNLTIDSRVSEEIYSKNSFLFLQTHKKNTLLVRNIVLPFTMTSFASYPNVDILL